MVSKNEIYVGLPFLKCSNNPSQTINVKTNKKSKTAVTRKIVLEAFERFGNDPDIDKNRSNKNVYLTEIKNTEDYMELIEQTKEKINQNLVSKNKKKLRKDTVDTIALVVKPSYDSMKNLSYEEQVKFLNDSKMVIEYIFGKYINPNFKFDGAIIHFDELNPHLHCLGMPIVIDETTGIETFNAKKFLSLKNITYLNRNYSLLMKELGWNVKDFNIYEDMTIEEKEKYKEKKKEYGRDSLKFKKEEKQKLEREIDDLSELKNEAVEILIQDEDVKELALNKVESEIKKDKSIQNEIVSKIVDNIEIEEIERIENEQKEIFRAELIKNYKKDKNLQMEAKNEVKKQLLEQNINNMSISDKETVEYYKKIAIDIGYYNDELRVNIDKLSFQNKILSKIIKFVSQFLPIKIQNKLRSWIGIDEINEVSEREIDNNIIEYLEEKDDVESEEI